MEDKFSQDSHTRIGKGTTLVKGKRYCKYFSTANKKDKKTAQAVKNHSPHE
jgi:hypothetical protein